MQNKTASMVMVAALILLLSAAPQAQAPEPQPAAPPAATRPMDRADLRRHIYVMEGALVRAVEYGAKRLNRELRSAVPEVMALSGEPQARGVYLENYGVYFDVAVPVLNQMVVLSLRTMFGPDEQVVAALEQLKAFAQNEKNAATRSSLEHAIARIELQLGPMGAPMPPDPMTAPGAVGAAMVDPAAAPSGSPAPRHKLDKKYFQDPNAINHAYTESVQAALIDTMLDYAVPMAIRPDEYLTVAARDNMHRDTLAPPDPYEEVVTILLRVKGSDLAAFRKGDIDTAEIRRRVEVREW